MAKPTIAIPDDITAVESPKPRTDPELQAMAKIDKLLAELSASAQYRIVEWLRGRLEDRQSAILRDGSPANPSPANPSPAFFDNDGP